MLFAWAMKFNRKYVGPTVLYTITNMREYASCTVFEGRGGLTPLDKARLVFSHSEKSERDLPASERETVGESLTGLIGIL